MFFLFLSICLFCSVLSAEVSIPRSIRQERDTDEVGRGCVGGDDVDDSGDVDVDVDGDGEVMVMIMAMASLMARALSRGLGRVLSGP